MERPRSAPRSIYRIARLGASSVSGYGAARFPGHPLQDTGRRRAGAGERSARHTLPDEVDFERTGAIRSTAIRPEEARDLHERRASRPNARRDGKRYHGQPSFESSWYFAAHSPIVVDTAPTDPQKTPPEFDRWLTVLE